MTSSPELPDDTAALCDAVAVFIRPGLREQHSFTLADAFAEEVQLRAAAFEAEHKTLIELAAVVRGEVRSDLRQAHPGWRLEVLLIEELELRKADADEATRVAVDGLKQLHVASIAAMQKTIDDLAQAIEVLTQKLDAARQDASSLRETLSRRSVEVEDLKASLRRAESEKAEPHEKGCAAVAKRNIDLYNSLKAVIRKHIRDSIAQTPGDIEDALAEELRLRAAAHTEQIEAARDIIAAATADRDEARNRAAVLEAGLRDMERRVVQSQSRIIDLHRQIERRDHRASEIEAAIVDLVVAHHRACSNERIMRSILPDPRRAEPAAAEKSTVIPL